MRRLLLLVAVLVFVDTMLYAALTPLLPHLVHDKRRAGILVAAYAAGALIGGLPGGVAAVRLGARRAVLLGLTGMGIASVGFAFAGGFWTLFAARLLQGLGSGFTWAGAFAWLLAAAPANRRGELIGSGGSTFTRFVLEQRLERAHRALADVTRSGVPISAIAYESGFADLSNFNRAFRQRFGCTPTDVRNIARSRDE